MPARSPNFQLLALITSGTFNSLGALWIYADGRARLAQKPLFAALATLLLGPLWLAFYMTDRPLRPHERRRGGFGFAWTRNFAIAWTASMAPWLAVMIGLLRADVSSGRANLVIVNPGSMLAFWLVPIIAALAIGQVIRRADAMEVGGPAPAATRIPLAVVSLLAAVLTFLLLTLWFALVN
jgi:hypothetical protein